MYPTCAGSLRATWAFVEHCNYRRYHEGIGDVTRYDVYADRRHQTRRQRREAKTRTLQTRESYNGTVRGQGSDR